MIYHGKAPWSAPCEVFDLVHVPGGLTELVAAHVPRLRFQLLDLAGDDPVMDRRLEEALTAFGRVVLWAMEVADEDERMQDELPRMLRLLDDVVSGQDAQAAFGALLRYLFASHERIDRERLRRTIEEVIAPTAGEFVVTEYDRIVEEGRRKGGGMVLVALLEAKLGPVTEDVRTRVNAATPAELTAWATRVLTAATLADVFDAPAAPPAEARPPATRAARRSPSAAGRSNRSRR